MDEPVNALPAVPEQLLNVQSGELLPATLENAGLVLRAARDMRSRISDVITDATQFVVERSRIAGTKTLHEGDWQLVVRGGDKTDYDLEVLERELREAGCPEERLNELITQEVSYKLNRSVLKQLTAANPDYRAAVEKAAHESWEPFSVSVKSRHGRG